MSPTPTPPQQRMIAYVDGFNLYHGLKQAHHRQRLWLDIVEVAQSARRQQRLVKVKYFTAVVLDDPVAQANQAHYIAALEAKYPYVFETHMGRYQSKTDRCHNCGHEFTRYEEKETDVNIATEIVVDAAQHAMDTALIISADSDLAPAVRAAQKIRHDLFALCFFPPKRYSAELSQLMPRSMHIGKDRTKMQLPDSFTVGSDVFKRPAKWR